MKKTILIFALMATVLSVSAQRVSSRAKAVRMLAYARPEYQVKDVKVYADTMTVFSLADYPIYPLGKWSSVEQFITNNQLLWYRESGYKSFYDTMTVAVNSLTRLDGTNIHFYRSIWTDKRRGFQNRLQELPQILHCRHQCAKGHRRCCRSG